MTRGANGVCVDCGNDDGSFDNPAAEGGVAHWLLPLLPHRHSSISCVAGELSVDTLCVCAAVVVVCKLVQLLHVATGITRWLM